MTAFTDDERDVVARVIAARRDVRSGFSPRPVPDDVVHRLLAAAHTAPSVGFSQPWDFVVVRDRALRTTVRNLVIAARDDYASQLPWPRALQLRQLRVEAILDTPLNIAVTCDATRGGRHTLGRATQPQMSAYSTCLAVENLWLAARAEGIGVGWVSFFGERDVAAVLRVPSHVEVVAYLCVGYVDEFAVEPELASAGWAQRRPLSWAVHQDTWGRRGAPGRPPSDVLDETLCAIEPADAGVMSEARERQDRLTKPRGALGALEDAAVRLAGITRSNPPQVPEPAAVAVFAGDHGVHAQGVTPWPQDVTAQMVANFLAGGAAVNAFAAQVGAEVVVVDVGVAGVLDAVPGLLPRKIRAGTADFTQGQAMTRDEARAAVEVGIEVARDLAAAGNRCLVTGDMGISNTTASAALVAAFTGRTPLEVTGRGTGIDEERWQRKVDVVAAALSLHRPDPTDPLGVLACVGGLEHAAIAGFILGAAALHLPVILDGVIAGAAALAASRLAGDCIHACIAGHRSTEPAHAIALQHLGLEPLVDLGLRLGEGTGALLALPLLQCAARALRDMATFDAAGVTEKTPHDG